MKDRPLSVNRQTGITLQTDNEGHLSDWKKSWQGSVTADNLVSMTVSYHLLTKLRCRLPLDWPIHTPLAAASAQVIVDVMYHPSVPVRSPDFPERYICVLVVHCALWHGLFAVSPSSPRVESRPSQANDAPSKLVYKMGK